MVHGCFLVERISLLQKEDIFSQPLVSSLSPIIVGRSSVIRGRSPGFSSRSSVFSLIIKKQYYFDGDEHGRLKSFTDEDIAGTLKTNVDKP
jgi:hypothetical protein